MKEKNEARNALGREILNKAHIFSNRAFLEEIKIESVEYKNLTPTLNLMAVSVSYPNGDSATFHLYEKINERD